MRQEIFRMERVTYVEKGIMQLEDFNLRINQGEIMGFLPINGQGLPAFLKLLQNNMPLNDGFVYYGGKLINSWKDAQKGYNRITIVQSRSSLVEGMTVADNIFVLRQGFRQRIIRPSLFREQLAPFFRELEQDISADTYVEKLSSFERIVVELLKAVITGNKLIVLNEISFLINESELRQLYGIMRKFARQGISFLFISTHYEEILQICDRMSIFSHGQIQKVIQEAEMTSEVLIQYIDEFYKAFHERMPNRKELKPEQDAVFVMKEITCDALKHLNLQVYKGECIAVQCFDHVMFQTLSELLRGEREPEKGEVLLEGRKTRILDTKDIAVIQEQPTQSMIFYGMDYMYNLCFGLSRRLKHLENLDRIEKSIRMEYGSVLGEDAFSMQMEDLTEKQKYQLIYTRILLQKPKIVFCIQPYKWTDLPHRVFVGEMIEMLLDKGITVVILALNLSGVILLAERLIRIDHNGMAMEMSREEVEEFLMIQKGKPH